MSANQASLPLAGSIFPFAQRGQSGAWVSDLLPHTTRMVDDLCFVKSMFTEAINHDPAITFLQTGSQLAGRPSIGSWLSYGLGSANANLPTFVVLISRRIVEIQDFSAAAQLASLVFTGQESVTPDAGTADGRAAAISKDDEAGQILVFAAEAYQGAL